MKIKKDKDEIGITIIGIVWTAIHIGLIFLLCYSIKTGEHIARTCFLVLGYAWIDLVVYKFAEYLAKDNSKSKKDNTSVSIVKPSEKGKSKKEKNVADEMSEDLLIIQSKDVTCPICEHTAVIEKISYDGYIYGQCDKCNIKFIEKSILITRDTNGVPSHRR